MPPYVKPAALKTTQLVVPQSFIPSQSSPQHTPKHISSFNRTSEGTKKSIHVNIKGNVKVTNHIILFADANGKTGSEKDREGYHSATNSASNSPASKKHEKIKSKDEGTDLADPNNEPGDDAHLFTPPHNPLVKVAYFSQHK